MRPVTRNLFVLTVVWLLTAAVPALAADPDTVGVVDQSNRGVVVAGWRRGYVHVLLWESW